MTIPGYSLIDNEDGTFSYPMNNPKRGYFVIFNQAIFDDDNLKGRDGTDKDVEKLKDTASLLGFDKETIEYHEDKTKAEIETELQRLSSVDHSENDCFVCVILTHGRTNDVLFCKDGEMKLSVFTDKFNADKCQSLIGKPKLFFVQACRGVKTCDGQRVIFTSTTMEKNEPAFDGPSEEEEDEGETEEEEALQVNEPFEDITIPVVSDFLIVYATIPSHVSSRYVKTGSSFIQSLAYVLTNFGSSLELLEMMTLVSKIVATTYEVYEIKIENLVSLTSKKETARKFEKVGAKIKLIKQIPNVSSQLLAKVYFKPKRKVIEEQENMKSEAEGGVKPGCEKNIQS